MIQPFRLALPLAVSATGTAICLSVLAGWQRGGPLAERLVWVAVAVMLVVGTHLLPALVRSMPLITRLIAGALWLACMAATCYGHLTFFLLAQRHAGELRAGSVTAAAPGLADRSLTAVMADRATVTAQLATANARLCPRDCPAVEARRRTLTGKLDALDAEAEDIRRTQIAADRVTAQRDGLTADPVTARLAAWFGTAAARVDLLSGFAFAAVLEGVACLLWTVTLRSPPTVMPVTPFAAPVMVGSTPKPARRKPKAKRRAGAGDPGTPSPAVESADPAVTQLAQDVVAGRVRLTVSDIRRHLGCSQTRAAAMRRQLVAFNLTA